MISLGSGDPSECSKQAQEDFGFWGILVWGAVVGSAAMSQSHQALGTLVEELEQSGADRERLRVVRCALNFKRAWVELAEALAHLKQSGAFRAWGYEDLHSYCASELHIKAATVEKLLVSLTTVQTYAPEMLANRMAPAAPPSLDALDYFSKAVDLTERAERALPEGVEAPANDVVDQLRAAVFDEGRSVKELRKQFNPVLRPKSPEEETVDGARKTRAAAQRLLELVNNLDGLTEKRVGRVVAVVESLLRDLEVMAPTKKKASSEEEEAAESEAIANAG